MQLSGPEFSAQQATIAQPPPIRSTAYEDIEAKPLRVTLQQRHFASGDYLITLRQFPELVYYPWTRSYHLPEWSIELPKERIGDLNRNIVRRFLQLLDKAHSRSLTGDEEGVWSTLVAAVDYQAFWIDNAPFTYVEGQLVDMGPDSVTIRWHDGSVEVVPKTRAQGISVVDPDEWFSASARLGRDNALLAMQNVRPITAPDSVDGETLWRSWPTNRS